MKIWGKNGWWSPTKIRILNKFYINFFFNWLSKRLIYINFNKLPMLSMWLHADSVSGLHFCNKKLSYCWGSSRYDKISDNGRSVNLNSMTSVKFISLVKLSVLYVEFCTQQFMSASTLKYLKADLMNIVKPTRTALGRTHLPPTKVIQRFS